MLEKNKIEIVFTWRLLFYLFYLMTLFILISLAVIDHYENRLFMVVVWLMFAMSYPMSIFLIKWKQVY